ncbi:MAG TPA: hypothetical protein VF747_08100 [Blastocatellia bacterium]|jgi:hypothetical protein
MESQQNTRGEVIARLVEKCKAARRAGASLDEIRNGVMRCEIERLMKVSSAQGFLEWIKEDRDYSYYYYDAQQSGVCAKPAEALAMILESIAADALE